MAKEMAFKRRCKSAATAFIHLTVMWLYPPHLSSRVVKLLPALPFCGLCSHRDTMFCSIRRKTVMIIMVDVISVKVSLWPQACNILQVWRALRAKTPISHPPKTPKPSYTQRQPDSQAQAEETLFYYSFAVLAWLFPAVSLPILLYLFTSPCLTSVVSST